MTGSAQPAKHNKINSIVVIAGQRAPHLHFATDNQLAKPCTCNRIVCLGVLR